MEDPSRIIGVYEPTAVGPSVRMRMESNLIPSRDARRQVVSIVLRDPTRMSIRELDLRVHTQRPTEVRGSACSTCNAIPKRLNNFVNGFVAAPGIVTRNWNVARVRLYIDTQYDWDRIIAWRNSHKY